MASQSENPPNRENSDINLMQIRHIRMTHQLSSQAMQLVIKKTKASSTLLEDNKSDYQLVNKRQQNVHQNSFLSNDSTLDEAVQNKNETSIDSEVSEHDRESTPVPGDSKKDSVMSQKPSPIVNKPGRWVFGYILIATLAIGVFIPLFLVSEKERLRCDQFLQLHSKYPNLDRMLWRTLIVGVERAINDPPAEPTTFIFLINSTAVGESLLKDVTQIALKCFQSNAAIWRSSYDFRADTIGNDYGVALMEFREELDAKGVLVVRDLDQVPPAAAPVFFTICDTHEPLVPKAIIFFTINISDHPSQLAVQAMGEDEEEEASATKLATTILKDLWKRELHPDILDQLLVRLTENVFNIY